MFRDKIKQIQLDESQKLTVDGFINKAEKYKSLDDALEKLPDEYISFYLDNVNQIEKLMETYTGFDVDILAEGPEELGALGTRREPGEVIYKKIKYKGEIIVLVYQFDVWTVYPAFRSITKAIKYGRDQITKGKEK